jgi:hypothetical protein
MFCAAPSSFHRQDRNTSADKFTSQSVVRVFIAKSRTKRFDFRLSRKIYNSQTALLESMPGLIED